MSELLDLNALKAFTVPKTEDVVVESLGGKSVKLRALKASELVTYYRSLTKRNEAGKEQHHAASFLAIALCKPDGSPMFESMDEGMEELLQLPHVALLEMQVVASRLTPLNLDQLESRAKN